MDILYFLKLFKLQKSSKFLFLKIREIILEINLTDFQLINYSLL